MRFLGTLLLFVSAFVFVLVFKNVHEALPQLIADAAVRSAVERCVADAVLTLVCGIFAVVLGFWCLNEAQMRWLRNQMDKCDERGLDYVDREKEKLREGIRTEVYWLSKRIVELEAKLAGQSAPPSSPPPTT